MAELSAPSFMRLVPEFFTDTPGIVYDDPAISLFWAFDNKLMRACLSA